MRENKKTDRGDLSITLGDHPLKQERSIKYLGVYLDQNLSWNEQCDKLCVYIVGKLSVLCKMRSFVKSDPLKLLLEKPYSLCMIMSVQFGDIPTREMYMNCKEHKIMLLG